MLGHIDISPFREGIGRELLSVIEESFEAEVSLESGMSSRRYVCDLSFPTSVLLDKGFEFWLSWLADEPDWVEAGEDVVEDLKKDDVELFEHIEFSEVLSEEDQQIEAMFATHLADEVEMKVP